ncbi:MAG: methyl-accepting chemotaxis protein [Phormidesmis sp.]
MVKGLVRQFQNFKLRKQLLLLLLLGTVLPVTVVGIYGANSFEKATTRSRIEEFEEEGIQQANSVANYLGRLEEDIRFLSQSYLLRGLLQAQDNGNVEDGLSSDVWKRQLAGEIEGLVKAKKGYQKIRYIDETGQEIVRVQRDNVNRNRIEIVPESALRNRTERPYIADALKLAFGTVSFTDITLQRSEGEVLKDFDGVAHYSAPVFDDQGQRRGIIIANVFAEPIFLPVDEFEEAEIDTDLEDHFVIDPEGYYLHHTEPAKQWGLDLGTEDKFQADYSQSALDAILAGGESGVIESGQNLIGYAKVDPNPGQEDEHFYIVETLPRSVIYGPANAFKTVATIVTLLAMAVVLPIGIFRGRQLIGLVERLINGISTSSQQIFSTVSEQERIASQQAASVSETSATMEELEASSRQSAEQAMAAVEAAQTALSKAEAGSEAVEDTLSGMFTLEQKVDVIAQQIVNLSGQAEQISGISQLVSDFANQTNMLALNSSVEAVRAGEYGKGFAVVANEIRKLSEQSQQSAKKINGLVTDIQEVINKTVMVTEEGTKTAKAGVKIAQSTEQAFATIKQSVDEVVMNNQQVALTQKQQMNAIQQVVSAMESINRGSKEAATGIGQTRAGTEQLNQAAQSLQKMM